MSIDTFASSIYAGAEFLVDYFRISGNGYSSINTARSALSAIIKPHDSKKSTYNSNPERYL